MWDTQATKKCKIPFQFVIYPNRQEKGLPLKEENASLASQALQGQSVQKTLSCSFTPSELQNTVQD